MNLVISVKALAEAFEIANAGKEEEAREHILESLKPCSADDKEVEE